MMPIFNFHYNGQNLRIRTNSITRAYVLAGDFFGHYRFKYDAVSV
jgi:hypothetical protein